MWNLNFKLCLLCHEQQILIFLLSSFSLPVINFFLGFIWFSSHNAQFKNQPKISENLYADLGLSSLYSLLSEFLPLWFSAPLAAQKLLLRSLQAGNSTAVCLSLSVLCYMDWGESLRDAQYNSNLNTAWFFSFQCGLPQFFLLFDHLQCHQPFPIYLIRVSI